MNEERITETLFVEKSTGAGDEDVGRRGGDVAAEGVRGGG
jgi:hypothetical protein